MLNLFRMKLPIAAYLAESVIGSKLDRNVPQPEASASDASGDDCHGLWPCPLPEKVSVANMQSKRCRARLRHSKTVVDVPRLFICAGNYFVGQRSCQSQSTAAPVRANSLQLGMFARLRCIISSWLRAASGRAADLDRSFGKFNNLQTAEDKLSHSASISSNLFRDFQPSRSSSKTGPCGEPGNPRDSS